MTAVRPCSPILFQSYTLTTTFPFLDAKDRLACLFVSRNMNKEITALFTQELRERFAKSSNKKTAYIQQIFISHLYDRVPQKALDDAFTAFQITHQDIKDALWDLNEKRPTDYVFGMFSLSHYFEKRPHFKLPSECRNFIIFQIRKNRGWISTIVTMPTSQKIAPTRIASTNPGIYTQAGKLYFHSGQNSGAHIRVLFWKAFFAEKSVVKIAKASRKGFGLLDLSGGLGRHDPQAIVQAARETPTLQKIDLEQVIVSPREFEALKQSGKIVEARKSVKSFKQQGVDRTKEQIIGFIALVVIAVALIVLYVYAIPVAAALLGKVTILANSPALEIVYVIITVAYLAFSIYIAANFTVLACYCAQKIQDKYLMSKRIYTPLPSNHRRRTNISN